MAKIAYILLAHKDPVAVVQQAERLTAAGDFVAIHFDRRSDAKQYNVIVEALSTNPNVAFAQKRHKCGWGEWSLVAATLSAIEAALDAFPRASHFFMLSGDCLAIKSAKYTHDFLDNHDCDFIESFDFLESNWIKTGMKKERLIYRHFFNERNIKWLFYASMNLQRALGLQRKIPDDLRVMIGSQWWCLRRRTIEKIMDFVKKRRDVSRFFRTTWIPDETFFQTLVRHLIPGSEINNRSLTFKMFSDYGMPVTFYNDHYDYLLGQDYLFARKISPHAFELKDRLGQLYTEDRVDFAISGEGERLFSFLTTRGRMGRRFTPRFWEAESSIGQDRGLFIIVCKKWHIAKRIAEGVRKHVNYPVLEYIFNEQTENFPDLGGIENTLAKRGRHRRSLVRMLFDYYNKDKMLICLDAANFEIIEDFSKDSAHTHLLEVQCEFTDDYLKGHAKRIGLAGEQSTDALLNAVLPTVREDVKFEHKRLRTSGFKNVFAVRENHNVDENATQLAAFAGLSREDAFEIMNQNHIFQD